MDICFFKRVEKKYRVSLREKEALLSEIGRCLVPDEHGKNTISSLYIDTPNYLLIRNSIDARAYKEKLRLRSYGVPTLDTKVFLEIKKKYKGVVYKRRISLPLKTAYEYLASRVRPEESQIMNEIEYAMDFYKSPKPMMLVSYEREAYFAKDTPTVRVTFDSAVRYRENDLKLENGSYGKTILPENEFILEIKTDGAIPLWLAHALDKCKIYPTSYSKYANSYRDSLSSEAKGEEKYVCTV
ncbi:MAG: polyphosphate polymerase domain-containing protein [Clostridia bacterium]|nr:polyphosphate polymerase domain-containing protein [Clostridia bacterium]